MTHCKLCREAWEGDRWLTDGPAARGLLMVMSIDIAPVLCNLPQKAVDTREQLNSTLIRLTTQTYAGI